MDTKMITFFHLVTNSSSNGPNPPDVPTIINLISIVTNN